MISPAVICASVFLHTFWGAFVARVPHRCSLRRESQLRSERVERACCFGDYSEYLSSPRWDKTAPIFSEEELEDTVQEVPATCKHTCTLIYLHAFGRCGKEYVQPLLDSLSPGFSTPWANQKADEHAAGLRVVLPTARLIRQPWGPVETSWHGYANADSNMVGSHDSLLDTRNRVASLLQREIDLIGGRPERVFLGGLSQGCTSALDVYLSKGIELGIGGFVGSVGFWPSDESGFPATDAATQALLADPSQRERPVWLQSALDDQWVPWDDLVLPSVQPLQRKAGLPGLNVKTVSGRGHVIDQWEGDWLHEFLQAHAREAYEQ